MSKTDTSNNSAAPNRATVIDAALMEKAIALRAEGKSMKAIGAELGVKATGYLAVKIKATYGPDALARPAEPTTQSPAQPKPLEGASAQSSRRSRGVSAAKEA